MKNTYKIFLIFIIIMILFACVSSTPEETPIKEEKPVVVQDVSAEEPVTDEKVDDFNNISIYEDDITEEEKAFIMRYLDKIIYMAYYKENEDYNLNYTKSTIGKINEYLIQQGIDTIDFEQVEKLKDEQRLIFEEETGESETIIQWLANKLNAEIYIEISADIEASTQIGGNHYATAIVDLKAYETSTALLLATISYASPDKILNTMSLDKAKISSIQQAVKDCMPDLIKQIKTNVLKNMYRGIRYEVIIQNPIGDRIMSRFWEKLQDRTRDIQLHSQSNEEIKYFIWYIGSIVDLKLIIYNISETLPGLENLEMVLSRGKTITFNTNY